MIPLIKKKTKNDNSDKKNKIKAIIFFNNIIEVILVLSIVILFYITIPLSSSKVIYIPKGSTNYIITYLNKSGYDLNIIDKVIIKSKGYPQSGWIDLKATKMTKADFINKLLTSKAAIKSITLIPGETAYFFLLEISNKFKLSFVKLQQAYNKYAYKLDGNILAETYNLPIGMDEDHLVFYLISYTNNRYKEFSNKIFGHYIKGSWYKYVTIASIIQKEAADVNEMSTVSSVIQNRLKKRMPLQMDGTLNYGVNSHTKVTSKMIREDISSYNTYKYADLPENPVCAVSLDAIKAAIFPSKTQYLYFYRDKSTGRHLFTNTYKEHIENIQKMKNYKSKTPTKEKEVFPKKTDTKAKKTIKGLWNTIN